MAKEVALNCIPARTSTIAAILRPSENPSDSFNKNVETIFEDTLHL